MPVRLFGVATFVSPELTKSLQKYFNCPTFSDAVVRCGQKEYNVHKIILSAHSDFFAKAFDGPWKESSENVVELKEVDDILVKTMLEFMYSLDYYVDGSADIAAGMMFHVRLYSIADQYAILELKKKVTRKFARFVELHWSDIGLPAAIEEVYSSTPENDRCLRDIVTRKSGEHIITLARCPLFRETLQRTRDFVLGLLAYECVPWCTDDDCNDPCENPDHAEEVRKWITRVLGSIGIW